jgi:hypothetical protein
MPKCIGCNCELPIEDQYLTLSGKPCCFTCIPEFEDDEDLGATWDRVEATFIRLLTN